MSAPKLVLALPTQLFCTAHIQKPAFYAIKSPDGEHNFKVTLTVRKPFQWDDAPLFDSMQQVEDGDRPIVVDVIMCVS